MKKQPKSFYLIRDKKTKKYVTSKGWTNPGHIRNSGWSNLNCEVVEFELLEKESTPMNIFKNKKVYEKNKKIKAILK